jgi:hypothetical protein
MNKKLIKYLTFCLLILGATQMSAQYCTTGGPTTSSDSSVDSIGLTGDAGTIISYQKVCAAIGLEDLTATQSASVTAGSNYDVTVVFGTCGTSPYAGGGEVWIDWNQNDVFDATESIGTWSDFNSPADTMVYTFTIPTGAFNGTTRMRVKQQEGSTVTLPLDPCSAYSWGSLADFSIVVSGGTTISCPKPTTLTAANITGTSADLGWTENGTATSWVVEYGPTNFTLGSGMDIVAGTNPLTITGLTPITTYDFYVRAVCAPGDSSLWVGPISATTLCAVYSPNYFTDFATFTPTCWDEATNGNPATGPTGLGAGSWARSGTSARINLFSDTKSDWLLSPEFDLSLGGLELILNTNATDYSPTTIFSGMGSDDTLQVVISTDGGLTWAPIYTWDAANPLSLSPNDISIDLSTYTGTSNLFGIWASEGVSDDSEDYYVLINDFEVRTPPTCIDPSLLTSANLTATSVTLGWTENGTATSWVVEYGPTNFALGTGMSTVASTNPFNVTGLAGSTTYDFYVRAVCAPGDSSISLGPLNITTLCTALTAPYLEPFTSNSLPTCWVQGGATTWEYGSLTGTSPTGFADYGANTTPDHSAGGAGTFIGMDGSDNTNGEMSTLTSPLVDLTPLTNPQLSYWVFSNNVDDATLNKLIVEFYDGTNWTVVDSIQANLGTVWAEFSTDLSTFTVTGNAQVRFTVTGDNTGGGFEFYNDILIDDVAFREAPSCPAPTLLTANVTSSSVDFSWMENGGATSWAVEYGAANFAPSTGTMVVTGSNPLIVTGLMGNSSYDFYVRAICGAGDSSLWVGPLNATTPCASVPGDVSTDPILINTLPYSATGNTDSCYMNTTNNASADVWHRYIVETCTDSLIISLCGSDFDTYLRVFASDTSTQIFFNDDNSTTCGIGGNSHLAIDVANSSSINPGDTIFILVEGFLGNQGNYNLNISNTILCPPPANLVITEIMYNPPEGGTDTLEFVEIYNNDANPVDLTNYTLSGITYTFPAVTLPVGGYYVVGVNASAFNTVYGFAADGIATGGLANGGEEVIIRNAAGVVVDSVRFDDNAPWPSGSAAGQPDGGGSSLVLCDAASDNADGANWNACVTSTGVTINGNVVLASPGAANFCPAPLDVAVASFYNLDSVYCNVTTVSGSVIITNMSTTDATNVNYTATVGGTTLISGTIALLAGNASDTITVGSFPVVTGMADVVVFTSLTGDVDANNDTLSMTVYVSNIATTASVATTVTCNGDSTGSVMAVGTDGIGSYSYEWNADANLATATVMNMPAGMHTVVVMDSIGCTDTAMVTLTEPTAIVLTDSVDNVLCNGDSTGMAMVMATGGNGAFSFAWSNGITSNINTNVPAGSYTVTATDANGCMEMLTTTVAEPTALDVVITDNGDGTAYATATGGTAGYTFLWDAAAANQTTDTATALVHNGTYMVTVTDANGCTDTASVVITIISVNTIANLSNLNLFPNPTNANVFVSLELVKNADVQINITNSIGQLVISKELTNVQSETVELNTSTLASGVYMVQFTIGSELVTRKLIVSKQ